MAATPGTKEKHPPGAREDNAAMNRALLDRAKQEIHDIRDTYISLARMNEKQEYGAREIKEMRSHFDAFYGRASKKIKKEMETLEELMGAEGNEGPEFNLQYMRLLFATYYLDKANDMFGRWEKNPSVSHFSVLKMLYNNLGRVLEGNFFSMDAGSLIGLFFDLKPEFDACSEIFGVEVAGEIKDLPKLYALKIDKKTGSLFIVPSASTPAGRAGA